MANVKIPNRQLITLSNALSALSVWVRPGKLKVSIGQIQAALTPYAQVLQEQMEALLEEHCEVESVLDAPEGEPQERRKMRDLGNGTSRYVFKDDMAFQKAERSVLSGEVELSIPQLLAAETFESFEKHMSPAALQATKAAQKGDKPAVQLPEIDFGALCYVMDIPND